MYCKVICHITKLQIPNSYYLSDKQRVEISVERRKRSRWRREGKREHSDQEMWRRQVVDEKLQS